MPGDGLVQLWRNSIALIQQFFRATLCVSAVLTHAVAVPLPALIADPDVT